MYMHKNGIKTMKLHRFYRCLVVAVAASEHLIAARRSDSAASPVVLTAEEKPQKRNQADSSIRNGDYAIKSINL